MATATDYKDVLDESPPLDELCTYICTTDWYQLGVMLKLNHKRLDEIERQYSEVNRQRTEMFKLWLSSKGEEATRRVLIDVLTAKPLEEKALVQDYKEYLKISTGNC